MIPDIKIEDYNYGLDEDRIAKYPLPERDASKLLHYHDGEVDDHIFKELPDLLPEGAMMVFNDTKVVPARMFFKRDTGAHIEIFCLEPIDPPEYNTIFSSTAHCTWKCVVGNSKRWKNDILSLSNESGSREAADLRLRAALVEKDGETASVRFDWDGGVPFSNVLDIAGRVPIPPYLNRDTESIDLERYQTLYARIRGSVAAPTAGLHFTDRVLAGISSRGIEIQNVCLHVGAGTFLPVKSSSISGHPMHREPFVVGIDLLRKLCTGSRKLAAVGTTSVRTLESLYYAGVDCIEKGHPEDVTQWAPYEREYPYSTKESLEAIIRYLETNGLTELKLGTRIIIVPGFKFRIVYWLVTNFHQPESTLILLISAFVNGDWRRIYDHALQNGYRFLSYGDSSLLKRADPDDDGGIGPYNDIETAAATTKLSAHPLVGKFSKYIFPDRLEDALRVILRDVDSVNGFQERVMNPAVKAVLDNTSDGLTCEGMENLKALDGRFLAISNHRDIVLDPAITQYLLLHNGLPLTEIAVGSNLFSNPTVEMLFRCNRSVKVVRGLPAREMYKVSLQLSDYIRSSVAGGRSSVWIAQRQGRAKDGNDRTSQGLLKMFDMSGNGSFAENFAALNIVPMSISYEYDSCDIFKAREVFLTGKYGSYEKRKDEDMQSIVSGLMQPKGRIHLCVGAPLNADEIREASERGRNDRYQRLKEILDRRIAGGYKLRETNYIAYDMVYGCDKYASEYTPAQKEAFAGYVESRLDMVEKTLDREGLRDVFLRIYSNPVLSREELL